MAQDKSENKQISLNYNDSSVVFTNHIAITKVSNEEVEIAICTKSPDEKSADVTHRLIVTLPHFFRIKDVFNIIGEDIAKQLKQAEEK